MQMMENRVVNKRTLSVVGGGRERNQSCISIEFILPDPYSWDMHDVQRWILWLIKEKKLECSAEHMHLFYKVNTNRVTVSLPRAEIASTDSQSEN